MHPNARLIVEFHEAASQYYSGRGKLDDLRDMLSDAVVWHVPGRNAIAGTYTSRDIVLSYFEKRRDLARATFAIEIRDVLASDETVVILAGGTTKRGGRSLAWETVGLFTVEESTIASARLLPFDQDEFDEIWR